MRWANQCPLPGVAGSFFRPLALAYILAILASLGVACLLFGFIGLFAGEPRDTLVPLFLPGIVLTVIMGIFSPEIIRQYQTFEFRKLAAEIFRRS